jgi:hypothetical protein
MMSFTTKRYAKQPLIVRGPGAGATNENTFDHPPPSDPTR